MTNEFKETISKVAENLAEWQAIAMKEKTVVGREDLIDIALIDLATNISDLANAQAELVNEKARMSLVDFMAKEKAQNADNFGEFA